MVQKKCANPDCERVFEARGTQRFCSEHMYHKNPHPQHLRCLWCEKRIYNKSKFCDTDCLIRYRITGKTKAQLEKEETESRAWFS